MPSCPPSQPQQRGAALLLLIMLMGLGASMLLMGAFQPAAELLHEQQSRRQLAEAREALIGFATRYGRLPRPARSALDGTENPQPCDTAQSCTGFLPWVTLGIDGADAWGKLMRYSVTPSFTVVPIDAMTVGGDKIIVSRDNNGRPFYLIGREGCPLYVQCPPAVLYSSGKNNPGVSIQGTVLVSPASTNIDERQNDIATEKFMSRTLSMNSEAPGGEFDDIVTWIPTSMLYERMRAAHVLK